jgi:hypothetical protein
MASIASMARRGEVTIETMVSMISLLIQSLLNLNIHLQISPSSPTQKPTDTINPFPHPLNAIYQKGQVHNPSGAGVAATSSFVKAKAQKM